MSMNILKEGVQKVPLAWLTRDPAVQSRIETNKEHVKDLKLAIERCEELPPLVAVFDRDQDKLWLAAGFHRDEALHSADVTEYSVDVRFGTKQFAIKVSALDNGRHGLRRSNADKRRSVERLRSLPEYCDPLQVSARELAKIACVSDMLVGDVDEKLGLHKQKSFGGKSKKEKPDKNEVPAPRVSGELTVPKTMDEPSTDLQPSESEPTENVALQDSAKAEPERFSKNSHQKLSSSNSDEQPSSRSPDAPDCPTFEDAITAAKGQTNLIAIDLTSPETVAEIARNASRILDDENVMVFFVARPDFLSETTKIIAALTPRSGTILAGSKFRAGVNGIQCRYIGLRNDLSKLQPSKKITEVPVQTKLPEAPPIESPNSTSQTENDILCLLTDSRLTPVAEIMESLKTKYKPTALQKALDSMVTTKQIFIAGSKKKDHGYSLKFMGDTPLFPEIESKVASELVPTADIGVNKPTEEKQGDL